MFRKAERKNTFLKMALLGPSGSGKTWSALEIATGLSGKIAMIDTENGSGEIYSDNFEYDVCQISPPFEPKKYINAIKGAGKAGYNVLIIDSISHAWASEGGLLDILDKTTKSSSSKNSYAAWREVTPQHNELVNAILQCKMHVIITCRVKTAYEIQEDSRGKKTPVKVGLAPVFREGIEYEMTVCLDLSIEGHIATASKHRTGSLLDNKHFMPSKQTGIELLEWLTSGKGEVTNLKSDEHPQFVPSEEKKQQSTKTPPSVKKASDAIPNLLAVFAGYGIEKHHLETLYVCSITDFDEDIINKARQLYKDIKSGKVNPADIVGGYPQKVDEDEFSLAEALNA